MESSIAALAMSMSMSSLQSSVSIGMMKKNMETTEASMDKMLDMMDSMPSPDGKGKLLNVLV